MNWILLWKVCLLASLALFAVMAVAVTIGGALDVRKLLRSLESAKGDSENEAGGEECSKPETVR